MHRFGSRQSREVRAARRRLGRLALAMALAATASACRQDMHDGAKYEPLEQSAFFKDKRGSRQLLE